MEDQIIIAVPQWLSDLYYRDADPPEDTSIDSLQQHVAHLRALTVLQDTVIEWMRFGMPVEVLPQSLASLDLGDEDEDENNAGQ